MAHRPVFVPMTSGFPFVQEVDIEFEWFPGFALSQAQKSIAAQHRAAAEAGLSPVLEISSKSPEPLGVSLSAFHLMLQPPDHPPLSVECAFQGSKVFEAGGPYTELYATGSRDARTDPRLRSSGSLTAFRFLGEPFPTTPVTAFYDWLYLSALGQNPELSCHLAEYAAFSDIAFNPKRSLNCQARSAALYVSLQRCGEIARALADKDYFLHLLTGRPV